MSIILGMIFIFFSFGPIPRRPGGGRSFFLFDYRCIGRETRIEYCTISTGACTLRTVNSSSIGVVCGSFTDEGEGDVVIKCGSGLGTRIVLSVTLFVVANGLHKNMFRVCLCSHIHVVDHEKKVNNSNV